eukprot:532103-Pyramimonas_sp.AAC.1
MARATQNLAMATGEHSRQKAVIAGNALEEQTPQVPLIGRAQGTQIRVALYCGPARRKPDCAKTFDPEFGEATLGRAQKDSAHP